MRAKNLYAFNLILPSSWWHRLRYGASIQVSLFGPSSSAHSEKIAAFLEQNYARACFGHFKSLIMLLQMFFQIVFPNKSSSVDESLIDKLVVYYWLLNRENCILLEVTIINQIVKFLFFIIKMYKDIGYLGRKFLYAFKCFYVLFWNARAKIVNIE